jgi:hypothetical protein
VSGAVSPSRRRGKDKNRTKRSSRPRCQKSPAGRGETASGVPAETAPEPSSRPAEREANRRAGRGGRRSRLVWLSSGTVTILVGGAGLERHHPALEMILLVFGAGFPALLIVILVAVILFGSKEKLDRAFRLLRWLRDKPEPAGPPGAEIPADSTKDPEIRKPGPAELTPGSAGGCPEQARPGRAAPLPARPARPVIQSWTGVQPRSGIAALLSEATRTPGSVPDRRPLSRTCGP